MLNSKYVCIYIYVSAFNCPTHCALSRCNYFFFAELIMINTQFNQYNKLV